MSKYRKQFLGIFKPMWAGRLPEWQPGLFSPSFWTKPDATFSWMNYAPGSATRFHAFLEFSDKVAGMFTCDIFITGATNKLESKGIHRMPEDIPTQKPGAYRIGGFISKQDVWWHLRDEVGESNRYWEKHGRKPLSCLRRKKHDWYAASYDVPQEQIVQQAAEDFTNTFLTYVSPKLFVAQAA
jgi:hypothetical protein